MSLPPAARFDPKQITERDWLNFQAVGDGVGRGEVKAGCVGEGCLKGGDIEVEIN